MTTLNEVNFNNDDAGRIVSEGMNNGAYTILEIVSSLQDLLVSKDGNDRARGVQVISEVLQNATPGLLNQEQLSHLAEFFMNRMMDSMVVQTPLLSAIYYLFQQQNLSEKDAEKIMRKFFLEIHCQSFSATDRRSCFRIVKQFCANFTLLYESMFDDVLIGVMNIVQNERDPRNLLIVYSLVSFIASSKNLTEGSTLAEELFEIPAAYFPINFVPPADDPYDVSSEDLVLALRECLTSTTAWTGPLIDLLLEKIDSDVMSAKVDAYKTLSNCKGRFSSVHMAPHGLLLWSHVRRDVLEGREDSVTDAALKAFECYVSMLFTSVTDAALCNTIITTVLNECTPHITATGGRLMATASKLLLAAVAGSPQAAEAICSQVLPLLVKQITNGNVNDNAPVSLASLSKFLQACAQHSSALSEDGVLAVNRQSCADAVTIALKSDNSAVLVAALEAGALQSNVWQADCQSSWAKNIMHGYFNSEKFDSSAGEAASSALQKMSCTCTIISEELLPYCTSDERSRALKLLVLCCRGLEQVKKSFDHLWPQVMKEPNVEIIHALEQIIVNNAEDSAVQHLFCHDWDLENNMTQLFTQLLAGSSTGEESLKASAALCRALIGLGSSKGIAVCTQLLSDDKHEPYMVFALDGLLCNTQDMTGLPLSVVTSILSWSVGSDVPQFCADASSALLANVIVKLSAETLEEAVLPSVASTLDSILSHVADAAEGGRMNRAVVATARVGQALEMRGHKSAPLWTNKLSMMLAVEPIGMVAAKCFKFYLEDDHHAINSKTHTNVRLFYRQRVFSSLVPTLVEVLQVSTASHRRCLLVAISALLNTAHELHVQPHLSQVVPVVIEGIRCTSEPEVLTASLNTLHHLLLLESDTTAGAVAGHLKSHMGVVVESLLHLSTSVESSPLDGGRHKRTYSLGVRHKALLCLALVCTLPQSMVLNYKEQVIRCLKPALDDHKRIVRRAAGDARSAWMLVL